MLLADLVAALPQATVHGDPGIQVRAIVCDSRRVVPGSVFVAYRGVAVDGHDYISRAVASGAVAIVAEHEAGDLPS
ncbi:MAG: Mur ligase domain-containing protein, partial [Anaerolineae bacterium]